MPHRHAPPQHQDIEDAIPKLPFRAVKRENPRFGNGHQRHNRLSNLGIIHFIEAKESLKPFVVRIYLGLATETRRQFTQVHRFDLQQGNQKSRQKAQSSSMPS
jgi:hypothetical protein